MDDVLTRLRDATGAAHARLEARLSILDRIATPDDRRELVGRFHGLHAGAERALSPLLDDLEGLDFGARRRVPRLAADLAELGAQTAPPPCPVAALGSIPQALGLLYVLEGSSLGAKVIRRAVAARGEDFTGLSFLDPYGDATGARWRDFLAVLARECPAHDRWAVGEAARGGVEGFDYAEAWLCEPEAVA